MLLIEPSLPAWCSTYLIIRFYLDTLTLIVLVATLILEFLFLPVLILKFIPWRWILYTHGLRMHAPLMSLFLTDIVVGMYLNLRTVLEFIVHTLVDYIRGEFDSYKFVIVPVDYQIPYD